MKKRLPEALVLFAIIAVTTYGFAQTWTLIPNSPGGEVFSVAASADGRKIFTVDSGATEWVSTNFGNAWQQKTTSYPISLIASSADGNKLTAVFAAGANGYVYVSTNSGNTWTQTSSPHGNWHSCACSADGAKLVAAIYGGLIYTSTNSGTTWQTNSVPQKNWLGLASSADGTRLAAVADIIYTSTNSGLTWTPSSSLTNGLTSIASSADGTELIGTGSGGTCISHDSGNTWTTSEIAASASDGICVASSSDGSKLLICKSVGGFDGFFEVYTSSDFGFSWVTNDIQATYAGNTYGVALSADGNKAVIAGYGVFTFYNPSTPQLNLADSNTNLVLSWLMPSTNFVVQQSPDLVSWSTLTNPPSLNTTNLNNQMTLSPSNTTGFFRLISQ